MVVNRISDIIRFQQQKSDDIYQDAIEANFSHEQMTPLNCILNCSEMLLSELQNEQAGAKSEVDIEQ